MSLSRFALGIVLLFITEHALFSQSHITTDSLLLLFDDTRNKNRQIELLKELSDETSKSDINLSSQYAQRGLILAQSVNDDVSIARFNTMIAHNEYYVGNYKEALDLYLKSLIIYERISDIKGIIGVK